MAHTKSIHKTNAPEGAVPNPTIWTFVQAAVVASLVMTALLLVVFSAEALGAHRGGFWLGLLLIPFATLVVWTSATVLYLVFRAAGLVSALKRQIEQARSSPSGKSVISDDWLDIPEPHHR
jgi:ABC-type sugar transport system permease subunit